MADTHRLTSCEAGMPVRTPPLGSTRSSCGSDPAQLLVSSEHAVLAVEFFRGWQTPTDDLRDGRHPPISCEAGIPVQMPPPGSSRSSRGGGRRNSWLAPSKPSLLSSFFSTLLTPVPRLVFLSITVLVNTLANVLHLPGDGALRACLCPPRHRPRGVTSAFITALLGASDRAFFAAPTPTPVVITLTVRPGFSIGYAPSPGSSALRCAVMPL